MLCEHAQRPAGVAPRKAESDRGGQVEEAVRMHHVGARDLAAQQWHERG